MGRESRKIDKTHKAIMKISIIIATWNAAKTLRRCLDSIVPQLTDETELILIDGGSKDETNEIIDSYGSKIAVHVSEPDKGIYDAWNKGVRVAKGDWMMFVGADDVLLPDAIKNYMHFTENISYKDIDFISCRIKSVKEDRTFLQYTGKKWNYGKCRINMDVTHVASLTSMNYFNRIGLFDINYKICGDYELLMRGGKEMRPLFLDKVIAEMPIGGASFSVKGLKEQLEVKHATGKVPLIICYAIFSVQLLLFYTYSFRHSFKL